MKKFRTYKKYSLVYGLEGRNGVYNISIEKSNSSGVESCSYTVNGTERELKALVCRLWSCGVTPMSLVYILEDEGYIPSEALPVKELNPKSISPIVHRRCSCAGKALKTVLENNSDDKIVATLGSGEE